MNCGAIFCLLCIAAKAKPCSLFCFVCVYALHVTRPRVLAALCIEEQCYDDNYTTTSCGLVTCDWLPVNLCLLKVSGRRLRSARWWWWWWTCCGFCYVCFAHLVLAHQPQEAKQTFKKKDSRAEFFRSSTFDRQVFWQRLPGSAHQGFVFQPSGQAVFSPQTNRCRHRRGLSQNHFNQETSPELFGLHLS